TGREIFGDRRAVLAWGPSNDARAVAVDGGYRIEGTWSFGSGCRHATWLRGTGSDAFTVRDLFVPEAHTVSRDDPAERKHGGPLYCFPSGSLYAAGFSGVAMGIARSSLDAFVELARDKEPRSSKRPLRDSGVIQFQVAEAEAKLGSARAFLLDALARIWAEVSRSGQPLSLPQRVQIRLAS